MSYLEKPLQWISNELIIPYNFEVAFAIIATLLVLYGDDLNQLIRQQIKSMHFVMRSCVYILICTFGYGVLTMFSAKLLAALLHQLNRTILPLVIIGTFILISLLADRKRHI
jgi:undecaprenyl pyrophosphate phosphatase UppP